MWISVNLVSTNSGNTIDCFLQTSKNNRQLAETQGETENWWMDRRGWCKGEHIFWPSLCHLQMLILPMDQDRSTLKVLFDGNPTLPLPSSATSMPFHHSLIIIIPSKNIMKKKDTLHRPRRHEGLYSPDHLFPNKTVVACVTHLEFD